ncbi:MAG: hypothetical protein QOG98_55, partial [Pseudonocardiales bacterium]|nr:hypothetical protein [Pseudonocardiales bacterium]
MRIRHSKSRSGTGGQKLDVPFGVPSPLGPSQPVLDLVQAAVVEVPLEPVVTSLSPEVCAHVYDAGYEVP